MPWVLGHEQFGMFFLCLYYILRNQCPLHRVWLLFTAKQWLKNTWICKNMLLFAQNCCIIYTSNSQNVEDYFAPMFMHYCCNFMSLWPKNSIDTIYGVLLKQTNWWYLQSHVFACKTWFVSNTLQNIMVVSCCSCGGRDN